MKRRVRQSRGKTIEVGREVRRQAVRNATRAEHVRSSFGGKHSTYKAEEKMIAALLAKKPNSETHSPTRAVEFHVLLCIVLYDSVDKKYEIIDTIQSNLTRARCIMVTFVGHLLSPPFPCTLRIINRRLPPQCHALVQIPPSQELLRLLYSSVALISGLRKTVLPFYEIKYLR